MKSNLPSTFKRILVVDDNRDVADTLAMLVRVLGHEVKHAYSGQEALDTAATFKPEIVFLDIAMPNVNGFEVARQLNLTSPPNLKPRLVALTGFSQDRDLLAASQAGFSDYLVKPNVAEGVKRILGVPSA